MQIVCALLLSLHAALVSADDAEEFEIARQIASHNRLAQWAISDRTTQRPTVYAPKVPTWAEVVKEIGGVIVRPQ